MQPESSPICAQKVSEALIILYFQAGNTHFQVENVHF